MESSKDFIKVTRTNGKSSIIPKFYIHEISENTDGNSVFILCYPGMRNTPITVNDSISTIFQHLQ